MATRRTDMDKTKEPQWEITVAGVVKRAHETTRLTAAQAAAEEARAQQILETHLPGWWPTFSDRVVATVTSFNGATAGRPTVRLVHAAETKLILSASDDQSLVVEFVPMEQAALRLYQVLRRRSWTWWLTFTASPTEATVEPSPSAACRIVLEPFLRFSRRTSRALRIGSPTAGRPWPSPPTRSRRGIETQSAGGARRGLN